MLLRVALLAALSPLVAYAAVVPSARSLTPNLVDDIERPLRYRPDGTDFVIRNGEEFFNRPLYGGNTAFRADAGDRPEVVLYLPGRGGNLRFGVRRGETAKWLHACSMIEARYRPGAMVYTIEDETLGADAVLRLHLVALRDSEGIAVRIELEGSVESAVELFWAYGGANGQRGRRDGDIGTEDVPIGQWFRFRPEFARDNRFEIDGERFMLESRPGRILGLVPTGARLGVSDGTRWDDAEHMSRETGYTGESPVLTGRCPLSVGEPLVLALQREPREGDATGELQTYLDVRTETDGVPSAKGGTPSSPVPFVPEKSDELFARAEAQRAAVAEQVRVQTPDPYLDAAVAALAVGADAVWDEPQGVVMHGAIAWRSRLLGWRGPYAMDALGWHDRARRHFAYWPTRQNLDPIPDTLPPPEEETNLARRRAALHSNGNMMNSHYDMNLVYIDALFRHLQWTGDLEFARELWPTIERHLAWERRMFRREFGPEKLPLYEAYAAIWASDDLQYHGGGVAYTTAYNYWHNLMAARLARLLGHDAGPYERERDLIARAMREILWMPDAGMFAEYKDLLGEQLLHRSPGLWSFYHVMDAELPTADEARRMTAWVDRSIPHIPVRGPGVPDDVEHHVLSTTDWMPYTWSVNNVVMGENIHTALGYWQAGRPEEAYRIARSALLASMFMGICPGNVGSMNLFDVYRRESQRDFADGSGVFSRALIEGLFGVRPDMLAGRLEIAPGFPRSWDRASLEHPSVNVRFERTGNVDRYTVASRLPGAPELLFRLPAPARRVRVTADGKARRARVSGNEIHAGAASQWVIEVTDAEAAPIVATERWKPAGGAREIAGVSGYDWRAERPVPGTLAPVDLSSSFNDRVDRIFEKGRYRSPRSPFVSLAIPAQGIGAWAGHVNASAEIDDSGLRSAARERGGFFRMPNDVVFATPHAPEVDNVVFVSQWDNFPTLTEVPLEGRGVRLFLLVAGSTNHMQSRKPNGEIVVRYGDGTEMRVVLENPTNWWPIDQDYFVDDFQFHRPGPLPPRVDLATGEVRILEPDTFKGRGGRVKGGAATVLVVPLDAGRELAALEIRAVANEVVIGLMAATIERP
jgi:hypothetical protein